MKKTALISSLDTIIASCEKTIKETRSKHELYIEIFFMFNVLERVISDLKLLRSRSLSEIAKKKAKRIKKKWELRNGRIITDKQMTQRRLNTADMYEGKVKGSLPISVNHKLAERIREMTNSVFNQHFGIASRRIGEKENND